MFKTITLLRMRDFLASGAVEILRSDDPQGALAAKAFQPCGPTQEISIGLVPPRGVANGALSEHINGQTILKFRVESKSVPGAALAKEADRMAELVEQSTGRKPGRKQMKELKEEAKQTLLPHAFAKTSDTVVWICSDLDLLIVGATGSKADSLVTEVVKLIGHGVTICPLQTQQSPTMAMAMWLQTGEAPADFTVDRELVLTSHDETKSVIRYSRHALDTEEIKAHIAHGKQPKSMALTYNGRVSFVLTSDLALTKVAIDDVVFEHKSGNAEDAFDADTAISTGELKLLLPALIEALGGELNIGEPAATPSSPTVSTTTEEPALA